MNQLNIALLQQAIHWRDGAANRSAWAEAIERCGDHYDVIVLPETFASGFTMKPEQAAEPMDGPTLTWMARMAASVNAVICGSLAIAADGHYYNRFVWTTPEGNMQCYDKKHLFRFAGEDKKYSAGTTLEFIDYKGWRILPLICYDIRFPVWCRQAMRADLCIFVANWPAPRHLAWERLLRARAIENQCYVVGVNRCGEDANNNVYGGGSRVLDYLGDDIVAAGNRPVTLSATLDKGALDRFRERFPFLADADAYRLE